MGKFVVLGLEGEPGLWLADLDAGTVTEVDAAAVDAVGTVDTGFVGVANTSRANGFAVVKGVDLAVASARAGEVAAQKFWPKPLA